MSFAAHCWNRLRRYYTAFKKRNIYDFFKYTSLANAAQKPFFKLFNKEFGKCPPAKHANIKHFFCWLVESTTIDIVKKVYGIYWNVWLCFRCQILNTSNSNLFTRVASIAFLLVIYSNNLSRKKSQRHYFQLA